MAMLKGFLLLFMIFSMGNAGDTCPAGWINFGLRCYKYFSHSTNWITAERNCLSLGGNLASVHNKLENDFLLSLLPSSTRSWVGAHDGVQDCKCPATGEGVSGKPTAETRPWFVLMAQFSSGCPRAHLKRSDRSSLQGLFLSPGNRDSCR
ncbi:unnamed protein product [Leuciscus chuanchicus]